MPGIIFANYELPVDAWRLLQHEPWLTFEPGPQSSTACCGRLSNGIFNLGQPARNERYTVFIDGEFSNRVAVWEAFNSATHGIPGTDHELILSLLMQRQELRSLVRHAEGGFFVAILDTMEQRVSFASDRFGLRPHYFSVADGRLTVAPEVKFCLSQAWVDSTLDPLSLAEYFNFQCILGDRTFFRGVSLFPSASVASLDGRSREWVVEKYWQPGELRGDPFRGTFSDAVEEAAALFRQSTAAATSDGKRYCVYLSGGLDSRQILAALPESVDSVHTVTFGPKGCRDQVYAAKLARLGGTVHHPRYFSDGKWLQTIAEKHTALTECFHCLFHAHNFWQADRLRSVCDVNLSGHFGDLLFGGKFIHTHNMDFHEIPELFREYVATWGIAFPDLFEFKGAWRDQEFAYDDLYESFTSALEPYAGLPSHMRGDFMALEYRGRKMIQYYLVHNRPYFEDRVPFLNLPLLRFLYSLPVEYRMRRRLQIGVLDRLNPRMAAVPSDKTNTLPTRRVAPRLIRRAILEADQLLSRLVGRHCLTPHIECYSDYGKWSAGDLATWIRSILLHPDAVVPTFFKDGYVDWVFENHIATGGTSFASTFKIGTMLSLEMMLQQTRTLR